MGQEENILQTQGYGVVHGHGLAHKMAQTRSPSMGPEGGSLCGKQTVPRAELTAIRECLNDFKQLPSLREITPYSDCKMAVDIFNKGKVYAQRTACGAIWQPQETTKRFNWPDTRNTRERIRICKGSRTLPIRTLSLGQILRNQSEHQRRTNPPDPTHQPTGATVTDTSYRPDPGISQQTWPLYSQQQNLKAADENQKWLAAFETYTAQEGGSNYTTQDVSMPNFGQLPAIGRHSRETN